jgi:hypothetical protein
MTKKMLLFFGKESLKRICTFLDEEEIAIFAFFNNT